MPLFGAVLVPIFCIDLERFEIPNQLNLLVFVIAVARDVYGIATHEPGHELVWHWLPASILGAVVGVAIFGSIRVIGWLWKRQEAMGLGDVLLARAMGAMLVSVVPAGSNPLGARADMGAALMRFPARCRWAAADLFSPQNGGLYSVAGERARGA